MKKALWLFVALTAIGAVIWWLWENIVWGKVSVKFPHTLPEIRGKAKMQ